MESVRVGVIGLGNMGSHHARYLRAGKIKGATLGAICDVDAPKLAKFATETGVPAFKTHQELLASKTCDAIIIAVPHYFHVPIALDAFAANTHVMSEKPIAVSVKAARQVNEAYKKYPHLKFGIMFQARTSPMYQKVRELVTQGELGEIRRVTWIATSWFRTWSYYASGGWRATWQGEGGGILINQCPHNLDMIQWALGGLMPKRVTAVGAVGKTHPIEVEDEMSAILEYANGATGHFICTTGEAPGTNRLEIAADHGKLVIEDGKIIFHRTRKSVQEINKTSKDSFANVESWKCEIPHGGGNESHEVVTQRWVDVIRENRQNSDLYAEGTEGVHGLELGNAMMMAGLTRKAVELPVDGEAYDRFIEEMHRTYGGRKTLQTADAQVDMAASFHR